MGNFAPLVYEDQVLNNKNLKWVHSLSAGIDGYVAKKAVQDSEIPLTNAQGAFSDVLAEFVMLGVLYHTKHVEKFMKDKQEKEWRPAPVHLVSNKTMTIVGFGSIGTACARYAKGFGMKTIGVKRDATKLNDDQKTYADKVVGNDELAQAVAEADFVVGALPKVPGATDDFFNMESTFSKMKSSGVFMNVGRGTCVNEEDLIEALKSQKIYGAVLDVFKKEPLTPESELWNMPNVLMTPHCADQDHDFMHRSMALFGENLERYSAGKELVNLRNKKEGY